MNKCIECLYKLDFYKIGIFICGKYQDIVPYNWKMCRRCKDFEKLYLLKDSEWENPIVTAWLPLPEPYKEKEL